MLIYISVPKTLKSQIITIGELLTQTSCVTFPSIALDKKECEIIQKKYHGSSKVKTNCFNIDEKEVFNLLQLAMSNGIDELKKSKLEITLLNPL